MDHGHDDDHSHDDDDDDDGEEHEEKEEDIHSKTSLATCVTAPKAGTTIRPRWLWRFSLSSDLIDSIGPLGAASSLGLPPPS